eukprot:5360991-Karenia_brevis.AAC.1
MGSGSLEDDPPLRPAARRWLFLEKSSVWSNLFRNQKPHRAERRNQDSSSISLLRACRCVPPDPTSASNDPVP